MRFFAGCGPIRHLGMKSSKILPSTVPFCSCFVKESSAITCLFSSAKYYFHFFVCHMIPSH